MTDPFEIPSQLNNPGGPSNRQRNPSGNREDMTMSLWHRILPDVRGLDIDLCSVCPTCKEIVLVWEASTDPRKAMGYIARLGKRLGVPACRVVHAPYDYTRQRPIKATVVAPGARTVKMTTWEELTDWANSVHWGHNDTHSG